jgi:PAS domain S-box-containing protein
MRKKDPTIPARHKAASGNPAAAVAIDRPAAHTEKASSDRRANDLAALYSLTDSVHRARNAEEIHNAAFAAIHATLGCDRASILMFDDAGTMRFVARRGLSDAYCADVEGHTPWRPGERDAEPLYVDDVERADLPARIRAIVKAEEIASLAFIPLSADGVVVGKFMIYYRQPHTFGDDEKDLAVAIARQLGFGIGRLRSEAARDAAETSLRESEERFRLMSEQAPVMIWLSDTEGRCLHLNKTLRTFWNVGEQDTGTFDWTQTVHPDDVATIGEAIGNALATHAAIRIQGRYKNAAGEYRILQTDCRPRLSGSGEFLGMIGVNVDVTERDRAERALRDSEERFRALFLTDTQGVIQLDRDGMVRDANPSAERILGRTGPWMIGRHIRELIPDAIDENGDYLPPEKRPAGIARRSGKVVTDFIIGLRNGDGELRWVDMDAIPQWRDGESEPWSFFLLLSDVTEQRRLANAEKTLAAEVDHRAKNMLALVRAIVRLSRSDSAGTFIEAVEGRIAALARAHSLLSESKWSDVELRGLVEEAVAAYRRGGDDPRISLEGPPLSLKPKVAQPISLMVHELTTNAAKYGSLSVPQGSIRVAWSIDESRQALEFIWEESGGPRVQEPTRMSFGSRLIQLTVERDLDGEVTKDWRPEGMRAVVRVPARHVGAATPRVRRVEPFAAPPSDTAHLDGKRILLVEDNAVIASEMCDTLARLGCVIVGPGRTLGEALRLAADERADAALLDIDLAGLPVHPLAEFLSVEGTPFAFCTGFAIDHDIRSRWPGIVALQKPVSLPEVASTLAGLLGRPASADADAI